MPDSQQLALPAHNNQHLFSDHYLNEILVSRPQWRALRDRVRPAMEEIAEVFGRFVPSNNERQTEDNLVVPILTLLGHTFEVQASLRTPEGTKTPDYVFYQNKGTRDANKNIILTESLTQQGGFAVGDAKYWNRPLDIAIRDNTGDALSNKNPSYQINYYMQHSGVTWGILTNGKQWRLYHKDSAHKLDHFYEVDLEEVIQSGDVGRFLYFHTFFRREAFDDGPLSVAEILRESADYAQSVGESLKDQVYDALRHIAQGFLDYAPNGFQPDRDALQTIYDNSLILLYRLLFILYAEARELLPVRESRQYHDTYSLHAIKESVARDASLGRTLLPESALLWPRLRQLFDIINLGSPPLSVATFNGGLFDPEKHGFLTTYTVGDAHLQSAIDKLARVGGAFVDYRDLSVRHMGTIYEGLLEYRLQPLSAPDDGWAIDLVNDKGERKTSGSYYTPDDIVKYIVEHTVGPVLERAVADRTSDSDKLEAVLKVNVLDPAMGSGHFLVEATEYIARYLVDLGLPPEGKTQEEADLAFWKRRVVQSCIYGVDLNPLAVELAKLSLWLTTVAKDRPLSFLDHHLRPGNSLVGARLEHLELTAVNGKSKGKRKSKSENAGQIALFEDSAFTQRVSTAVQSMWLIEANEAINVEQVKEQERLYEELRAKLIGKYARLLNMVTATRFGLAVEGWLRASLIEYVARNGAAAFPKFDKILAQGDEIAERERFFHWELEFPEIYFDRQGRPLGDEGGFEAVVGNPPWERIKLQENEFFARRDNAIALAPRAVDRKRLIAALPKKRPQLWAEYEAAKAASDHLLSYVRNTGFYPLMGRGDTNLYAVFAERALQMMGKSGRAGLLVPSGIATDDTTKDYFQHLVEHRMLAELLDFENRERMFPDVDSRFKFSVILMTGEAAPQESIRCGFFLHNIRQVSDPERICLLTPEDFRLFNPNTLTCPIFRRCRDAELTKNIYRHVPVLVNEAQGERGNPWGISFLRMFDMTNDSSLFRTATELEADGYWLGEGNLYTKGTSRYLPLYEAKMVHQFDHRYAAGVAGDERLINTQASEITAPELKADPCYSPLPRYWVPAVDVKNPKKFLLGFRDIARATDVRTVIASIIPAAGAGNTLCLIDPHVDAAGAACLCANLSSFVLDYAARQKVSSTHLNFFVVEQFPILPPKTYKAKWHGARLDEFIKERVLELCYTAHDLKGFAEDMGYDGPPFAWDEERRLHLRCQLDALYFHLYKLTRDEAGEILDTFPIVKRQDEARHGGFRTKDLILAYYNAYAAGNMDAWVSG
ncbi:MAG: N-6 DNA methylase [Armatimonadetes bacterium]|nr:N-6 DNA methylase [Armatimonadota bacterium]